MNSLSIFLGPQLVGQLEYQSLEERPILSYVPEWQQQGFPISPHLPLTSEHDSSSVRYFFENLLPEGNNLEALLDNYRVSKTQIFRILQIIGRETTGAFSFAAPATGSSFRPVPEAELIKRLDNRSTEGLIFWDGKPRLSVAGVQDKLPLTLLEEHRMGFGEGEFASTHILKFQKDGDRAPFLVLNEFFCMRLAQMVGLPVAPVEFRKLGSHPVLFVERFDRKLKRSKVERLHVIDGCQALNLPSSMKYERNFGSARDVAHIRDGATLRALFDFTKTCSTPAAAALTFINWVVFNLCIGNADAHAKNISYFIDRKGIRPAPYYDLVNIAVYPMFEQDLAMSVGDEFKLDQIYAFQLAELCDELKFKRRILVNQFKKIGAGIIKYLDREELVPSGLDDEGLFFVENLKSDIKQRTDHFLGLIDEVLKLELP
jgi:serine/threonine-protein kinase HipA